MSASALPPSRMLGNMCLGDGRRHLVPKSIVSDNTSWLLRVQFLSWLKPSEGKLTKHLFRKPRAPCVILTVLGWCRRCDFPSHPATQKIRILFNFPTFFFLERQCFFDECCVSRTRSLRFRVDIHTTVHTWAAPSICSWCMHLTAKIIWFVSLFSKLSLELWGTFSSNVKVYPVISWNRHNLFQRILLSISWNWKQSTTLFF